MNLKIGTKRPEYILETTATQYAKIKQYSTEEYRVDVDVVWELIILLAILYEVDWM